MENLPPFQVPIGQRQLFLDDYDIAETEHLTRTMHQCSPSDGVGQSAASV